MSSVLQNTVSYNSDASFANKRPLRFITCGNVDDGKSTLIGRLLWDTKVVTDDQISSITKASEGTNGGLVLPDFSLLLDGLQAEREQGITIDVAYRYFSTEKRSFIVADTPGHEQYTGNMATGASTADLSVILVDARTGIQEQTRRHIMITTLMGIKKLVLVINKMDLADYDQKLFTKISEEFQELAALLDVESATIIPASAKKGENVTTTALTTMPWYNGPTLLSILENTECENEMEDGFRLSVQRVSRPSEDFRGFQGTISGGTVSTGEKITVLPSGEQGVVERIVAFDGDRETASKGDAVTLVLDRKIDISRGHMITSSTQLPHMGNNFTAKLVTLTVDGVASGKRYWLKSGGRRQRVTVTPRSVVNLKTQEWTKVDEISKNTITQVKLTFEETAIFDLYDANRATGAFILIDPDTHNTVAGGMITEHQQSGVTEDKQQPENLVTLSLPEDLIKELLKSDLLSNRLSDVQVFKSTLIPANDLIDKSK